MNRKEKFKEELAILLEKYRATIEISTAEDGNIVVYSFSKFCDVEDQEIEEPIYLEFQDTITARKLFDS